MSHFKSSYLPTKHNRPATFSYQDIYFSAQPPETASGRLGTSMSNVNIFKHPINKNLIKWNKKPREWGRGR